MSPPYTESDHSRLQAACSGCACRDEREFPDADRFDMNREIQIQIVLGHGVHKCLGSYLARLEARVAFETPRP